MSKYDFELNLDNENSLSIIIKMMDNGSRVLEFGPANGRLTKYLSEQMNCSVDIVEIDEEAGKDASQFSTRSFIGTEKGDIEKFNWLKELKDERYDYIVFADVLEHLHNPKVVLEKCRSILKDTGSIILSVPNIAHNSVLIDLINDEFKYNNLGLLDNTHISFFTYKSLIRMIEETGYKSEIEKATFCKVGQNEIKNNYNCISSSLAKELKLREKADIYQYIFKIRKNTVPVNREKLKSVNLDNDYTFECYIKENNCDYNEEKTVKSIVKLGPNNIELDLNRFNDIKEIRIDPIDTNCIIEIQSIYTIINGEKIDLKIINSNGDKFSDELYIFTTNDPQIFLDTNNMNMSNLFVQFILLDYDLSNIEQYDYAIKELINNKSMYEDTIINMKKEYDESKIKYEKLILEKDKRIDKLDTDLQNKSNSINEIRGELEYYKLHYEAAIGQRDHLNNELIEAKNNYNIISNSTCWKITKPLRICLDGIKDLLKKNKYTHIVCRGIKYCKNNGIKRTLKKFKNLNKYDEYIQKNILSEEEIDKQINTKFSKNIKFSIVVPLYNTPEKFLTEMIDSCIGQTYDNWELCLADGSDKDHKLVGEIVRKYASKDKRIKYKVLSENKGISENTNECIKMSTGDYIALFDHDDILHPSVLYEYMKVICEEDADFIYCDEDKFEDDITKAFNPYFKPDFAIDNLRVNNYICHFTVFNKNLLKEVGLFRKEFDGSQDHDMILRLTEKAKNIVHVPKILYHWRVSSSSVASDPYAKPYTIKAGINAVKEHLERCNLKAEVESSEVHPNIYRIRYDIEGNPLVSILIPNKDHIDDLSRCIDSILEKSTYRNFEIIVIENNSTEQETFDYYKKLEEHDNIKVVTYKTNGKFNYSAINNFGVKYASGEHLLFLNNDIEIISENWLEEMLMYSQRNDIGAVGAKLYYPNDTIQHAGVILGLGGVAGHSHKYFQRTDLGYFAKCVMVQNYSAVTAACLMMKSEIFKEINGFDESFEVAFNDVDLCMRIRKAGYLIVWTPYAELYHYESISRGYEDTPEKQARFNGEIRRFKERWQKELDKGDPYYNINLTIEREDFSLK